MQPEKPPNIVARVGIETILSALFTWLLTAAGSMAAFIAVSEPWVPIHDVRWPLGAALGAGLGMLVLWIKRRKPPIYRHEYPDVTFHYEIILRSCTYRINSDDRLVYSKKIRLRALQNQLDDYIDKVNWSGGDMPLPEGDSNVYEITPVTDRVGMWTFYRVHFGRTLTKGEEIEFELTWPPITGWERSRPFVAMSTDEPTHRLEFHVQIPPTALAKPDKEGKFRAVFEELRAVESLIPFRSKEVTFDENGHLVRVIKSPMLYHYFKVRWFWKREGLSDGERRTTIPTQATEPRSADRHS